MIASDRPASVHLRPVTHDDRALVRAWLATPAVRAWWGSPAALEAEIAIALASESAICRMIVADEAAVGYGHALDAALTASEPGTGDEPGIWRCTFFIGSEAHRGLGAGAIALDLLADEVLSTTLAIGCETRVPVKNESAVREIEALGFRWHHVETDPTLGPVWVMRRERGRSTSRC